MKNLFLIALLPFVSALAQASDSTVFDRYKQTCGLCHASGAANAPKTANAADWAPRLEKGMDALIMSVEKGLNAMPPKGMCMDCSDEDFKALIVYMSTAN
jgi:cytochrome c5